MIWIVAGLAFIFMWVLLRRISTCSKLHRYLNKEAYSYAREHGNVPLSFSDENFWSLRVHNYKMDSEQFSFMKTLKYDEQKKAGFMLCYWYANALNKFGLAQDLFGEIPVEEFDQIRNEAILKLNNLNSDPQTVSSATLDLKRLALNKDLESAYFLADRFVKSDSSENDIQQAFFWLSTAHELDGLQSTEDKAIKLLTDYPNIETSHEVFCTIEQDLYLQIFKQNPCVENWKDLMKI